MSERKSFDVQPRKKGHQTAVPQKVQARRAPVRPVSVSKEPLRARRARARKFFQVVTCLFFLALLLGSLYALWRPALRISEITVESSSSVEGIRETAQSTLVGSYAFIIPHNSIFFFSESRMRKALLETYPEIVTVSFSRTSFHSISITAKKHTEAFLWCGTTHTATSTPTCYRTNTEGFIFEQVASSPESPLASSTQNNSLEMYMLLSSEIAPGESVIGAHVLGPERIPIALRFVRAVKELGVEVRAIEIQDDEASLWMNDRTYIKYILGSEERAIQLAASSMPKVNLSDGSIEYLDLRFNGKAFVKRRGAGETEAPMDKTMEAR